jgi:conjugal transfer pilus assembly protein TraV
MKHYFLSRYLPTNFSYKGFLRDFNTPVVLGGIASFCLTLCSCSTTSETFDCKEGKGVGCKSISEVNHMVDQGALGERDVVSTTPSPIFIVPTGFSEDKAANIPAEISLMDGVAVHRVSEEHLRVWMAPFQDEQGNLHEGSVIHTVLKPGYWQLQRGVG